MKKILFVIILILFCSSGKSQNWKTYYNYSTAVSVKAYKAPHLWYSSTKGLTRRNIETNEEITFTSANSSITSNATVLAYKDNVVWAGFDNGVGFYDGTQWTLFPASAYSTYDEGVSSIAFHPDGSVWVSGDHSIARYNGTAWKIYGLADGLPYLDNNDPLLHVLQIRITSAGTVWINTLERGTGMSGTTPALIKYENNTFSLFSIQGHSSEMIWDFDLVNNTLIITTDAGIYKMNGNQVALSYVRNGQPLIVWGDGVINQGGITSGIGDYFWLNLDNNFIKADLSGNLTSFSLQDLGTEEILGLGEEESGNLWFGTSKGITYKTNTGVTHVKVVDIPDIPSFISSMAFDANDNLWIGTDGSGLTKKSGGNWSLYKQIPTNAIIESLITDEDKNIWIAWNAPINNYTSSIGGLAKILPNGSITHYNTSNSILPTNFIRKLAFDKNGNLWASTDKLYKIEISGNSISKVTTITASSNGYPGNFATAMIIDDKNNIWLSYLGQPAYPGQYAIPALAYYNGNTWTHYNYQNSSLGSISVSGITIDSSGKLWALTNPYYNTGTGGSLTTYDGSTWSKINIPASLEWAQFYGRDLQFDKNGLLWISSNKGLVAYSPNQQTWTSYDSRNSPLPRVFNDSNDHSVSKILIDKNNTKYFSCLNNYIGKDGIAIYNENGFPPDPNQKQDQTIINFSLVDVTYQAGLSLPLGASATSQLPVKFSVTKGDAQITNSNTLVVNSPGKITIQASQAGDDKHNPAPDVMISFCVNPIKPVITEDHQQNQLTTNASSGNVNWFLNNELITSATSSSFYPSQNGDYKVRVTVSECFNFSEPLSISRQVQRITLEDFTDITLNTVTQLTIKAGATSLLPVSYKIVKGNALLAGDVLTLVDAGPIEIEASQNGNLKYLAAPVVKKTFCVNPPKPIIQNDNQVKLVTNAVTNVSSQWLRNDTPLPLTSSNEFIPLENGDYKIKITVNGCSNYSETITINRQDQNISFEKIEDKVFKEAESFTLQARASSALPVSFKVVTGNIRLNGNLATITEIGRVEIEASQNGNLQYRKAEPVLKRFCVNPPKPVLQIETETIFISSPTQGTIQWYLNNQLIPGATDKSYRPRNNESGNYHVTVTQNECTNQSDHIDYSITGLEHNQEISFLYPNPTEGSIYITNTSNQRIAYTLRNFLGQELQHGYIENNKLDLSLYKDQIILLSITTSSYSRVEKVFVK